MLHGLEVYSYFSPFLVPWNVVYPFVNCLNIFIQGQAKKNSLMVMHSSTIFFKRISSFSSASTATINQYNTIQYMLFTTVLFMPCDSSLTFDTVRKALKASSIEQKKRKVLSEKRHRPPRLMVFTHSANSVQVLLWITSALMSSMIARASSGCDDLSISS